MFSPSSIPSTSQAALPEVEEITSAAPETRTPPSHSARPSPAPTSEHRAHVFGTKRFLKLASAAKPQPAGDMKLAKLFGKNVIVYSSPSANVKKSPNPNALPEPGGDAMALAYKFCGAGKISLISSHKSPHLLEYHPRSIVNIEHSDSLQENMEADSAFFLNTSSEELQQNAANIPRGSCVTISNNASEKVAEQVALLAHIRPDLQVYGHASTLNDPKNNKGAVEAFRRVGAILGGEKSVVMRSLKKEDSLWIQKKTGVDISPGAAIPALFDQAGKLDRKSFLDNFKANPHDSAQEEVARTTLQQFSDIHKKLNLPEATQAKKSKANAFGTQVANKILNSSIRQKKTEQQQDQLEKLGKVLILGSTGNVGDGILRALSGRVEIDAPVRNPARVSPADHLGNVKYPVRQLPLSAYTQHDFSADTAFIAASAPRDKTRTDRAGQLIPNLVQVMIPLMAKIPSNVKLVQVITNPCADMTYAAWLLRPDLAGRISSHSGTDLVRQKEHVREGDNPGTYFTFGPHSPTQVNVDLSDNRIDRSIATKASDINARSGGQATTDPTSLSSIYEALNILSGDQSSYAIPLTADEATRLQEFLRSSDTTELANVVVSEGLAFTLPRKNGEVNWQMLEQARDQIPEFMRNTLPAIEELTLGRQTILDHVVSMVQTKRPELAGQVNHEWVLANRDGLLEMLNETASNAPR
ncbi:hypothetical protein [Herbaspirillum huttiense]|uniref:Uncharacterized protein n=2 Tax=Herbaspirillum huttiense TaxID=863372 RepID=A0AAJ2HFT2_9BURK|nr:hypothetical protein [Herbaspirillum huttiense]MDR9839841.1 hypothetical protein [Herbaspirillum huttiense]